MYWCLAALDEGQTAVSAPVSRDGAFCTKATVVGQSTDGLGEAAVSGRFTAVTVPKACMPGAGHVGTNTNSRNPGEGTVTDVVAARGVRSLVASRGGRSACLELPPGQGRVRQATDAPKSVTRGGVRPPDAQQPRTSGGDGGLSYNTPTTATTNEPRAQTSICPQYDRCHSGNNDT